MTAIDIAQYAENFVNLVDDYLRWLEQSGRDKSLISPIIDASTGTEILNTKKITEQQYWNLNFSSDIQDHGPLLAMALERFGYDSGGVLYMTHCAIKITDMRRSRIKWGKIKPALQQAVLRLRLSTNSSTLKQLPDGDASAQWSIPTSLTKLANALGNCGYRKAKSMLRPYGLKNIINRQNWTVRLDLMPSNLRKEIERAT